ncbi:glutathione S-transferase C-terminal-like protein [Laetiporus sulphureus 93-53]|uniref:glutathione transferase n=1 Tax=Laetiporus sulphureus 93-53 TaxID=1314785 RepID=A0A165E9M9_9APHY|nr:glutathione S-transferase C-terminal-like protein [Laetiporus sulphureus 93-53]KZT06537.1 glutathione S-transferase C-terminal-like protein [Laetiporus sulphureus 93-53]
MSHGKQFTLFTHCHGPNGWKVVFVLEELGLTYHPIYLEYWTEIKGPEHTKYNPNGRIPTLIDHANGDLVVWESNAILTYLVEKYDPEHKISAIEENDRFHQLQWLFFQASGQGPYFGQANWFWKYHSEQVPSATERYRKETMRIFGVLESVLSKQDWLVGDKCTIADLSFIPWNMPVLDEEGFMADYEEFKADDFPSVKKWHYTTLVLESGRGAQM